MRKQVHYQRQLSSLLGGADAVLEVVAQQSRAQAEAGLASTLMHQRQFSDLRYFQHRDRVSRLLLACIVKG
jgi:hypothetical protein